MKPKRKIDDEITLLLSMIEYMDKDTESYCKIVDNIKVLCEAEGNKPHNFIDKKTLFTVGVGIVELFAVLYFERSGVVTSKAFNWVKRIF